MVGLENILRQFRRLGVKPSFWAKAEIKELGSLLVPGEQLTNVVFGWYENGFALLCCTDQRVLLIDKKPFFLKLEDLRYDKISEVRFLNRLLDSTLVLSYAGMKLDFKSWDQKGLRKLMINVQETIMRHNQQERQISNPIGSEYREPPFLLPTEEPRPSGMSYELLSYPEEFVKGNEREPTMPMNPYAPTNRFLRRRLPYVALDQTAE
ncbi:PH domain-containing protein [Candidatus Saccharibacteria bacterium]|nr:PH domain-containing protein [Candidatus Saccharibacteria bacterium]